MRFVDEDEVLVELETGIGPQGEKGEKGDKGDKGDTGAQGPQGIAGTPGAAATLEITGAESLPYGSAPTVTEEAGSTAQARRYKLGIPEGKPGADGKTPVKGVDYFTDADKAGIVSDVLAALPNASGVNF